MGVQTQKLDTLMAMVESHRGDMVDLLSGLIRVPALGPKNGGQGERKKADWLAEYCRKHGFTTEEFAAPDDEVESGGRPNLVVRVRGTKGGRTLWVMSHTDVVPPGNLADWTVTGPFEPKVVDGRLYGRGSEDNGQSLAAAFWALKSVLDEGLRPEYDVGLLFVADEETGSEKGITWLLDEHADLFTERDIILVPDGGDAAGEKIEVSEKTILWLKFTVKGVQCHGSMPYLGKNAARAAAHAVVAVDEALHEAYPGRDDLFNPPESTIEPTRRDGNVPNINTIPGQDVFHFDCRFLPDVDSKEAYEVAKRAAEKAVEPFGCSVSVDIVQHDVAAAPTPTDAEVVTRLRRAIKATRGVDAEPWGVGGGTVAAIFRRRGFPAAVWSTYEECAHAPNEFAVIDNIVADAKVYAHLFTQPDAP